MDYKFSVVIPLYNVSAYLTETVDSVLAQSIGFEENIQLILVNDGSTDDTEQICLSLRDAYPDNVIYIYQDNAGVSAARNAGIPFIAGKYTNFMDGDDRWDTDAFRSAWDMFENCGENINVIACRMDYFEADTGYHKLDYKFKDGDMICDIFEHPTYGQFSVCSVFCRSEDIRGLTFDTRLSYGEDAKFINQLILKARQYGLLAGSVYHIRKRYTEISLTQTKLSKPTAYIDTARYYYEYLADLSADLYGRIIPYVQYALINALKYRVTSAIPDTIPQQISEPYIELLNNLISRLDDDVICSAPKMLTETKIYLFTQKYGAVSLKSLISLRNGYVYVNNHRAGRLFSKDSLIIKTIHQSFLGIKISGTIRCPEIIDSFSIRVCCGNSKYIASISRTPSKTRFSFADTPISSIYDFSVRIPASKCTDPKVLEWTIIANGNETTATPEYKV